MRFSYRCGRSLFPAVAGNRVAHNFPGFRGSRSFSIGADTIKILLVEDNELNRDMLSRRLMRKGYEVVIAVDGNEGLVMAESESLILS